jgi:hypothetical protein
MRIHRADDRVPRLTDVRARLAALEQADARARVETAAMTIVNAPLILDLTARPTARDLDFRPGASVWYREDIRLADGAARVVPAVFIAYRHQRGQCGIVRALTDDGGTRPIWVPLDDVFRRHWADDAADTGPRLAWAPPAVAPPAVAPTPVLVAISFVGLLGFVAFVVWGLW